MKSFSVKILLLFFICTSDVFAQNSCVDLLKNNWHPVSEHFKKHSTFRVALRRFKIDETLSEFNLTPREKVSFYFQQKEELYKKALNDPNILAELRKEWLKKSLIKKVPQSYIDHQRSLARRDGRQADFDTDFNINETLLDLQTQQKESFLRWFDYIMGPDIEVQPWLRYLLLKDLLSVGTYNLEKEIFSERNSETVGSYPYLNSEAFGRVHATFENYYGEKKDEISEDLLELVSRDEKRAFSNLYAKRLNELKKNGQNFDLKITDGKWVKFEKGNPSDGQRLYKSLEGMNTGWCTANSCRTSVNQVNDGDFYVYYSKDLNEEYTVPRLAIRMEDSKIAEVRGRALDQNADSEISKTNILKEKLKLFGSEGEAYLKSSEHMKKLSLIEEKHINKENLSKEELRFLYEIDEKIEGLGYQEDTTAREIIESRDVKKDIAFALDISEDQVSLTKEEALSGDILYHHGDLDLRNLKDTEGLIFPKRVGGDLILSSLTSAKGLVLPKSVGGSLVLSGLTDAERIIFPESVGGGIELASLKNTKGLVLPESVGGILILSSLTSAKGLVLPKSVRGSLILSSLTSAKGLVLPKSVGRDLILSSLTSAKGLVLPQSVGGNLVLSSLTDIKGLLLPKNLEGRLVR